MTSRRRAAGGFTLLEVMAAVLVLGLLYTVLAGAAMRGLRSEGTDRRRANAELIADLELSTLELEIASGGMPADGRIESEDVEEPFRMFVEVAPADLLARLPAPLSQEITRNSDPRAVSVLRDERGQSRVRSISVIVEWDEAGEPAQVERTTFVYDKAALAAAFPAAPGGSGEGNAPEDEMEELRKAAPPELQSLIPSAQPPAPAKGSAEPAVRSGRSRRSR